MHAPLEDLNAVNEITSMSVIVNVQETKAEIANHEKKAVTGI